MEAQDHINIESIWEEYYDQLLLFILKRVADRSSAEDILQNVFVKTLSNLNSLKDNTKIKSWLYQITRNTIIDHFRKSDKTENVSSDLQKEDETITEDYTEEVESWIIPFIERLPIKYREALILSEIEGMTQKDLAAHLGISYPAAKSRVQRGRVLLKEKLSDCCTFHADKYGNIMDYKSNLSPCRPGDPCDD